MQISRPETSLKRDSDTVIFLWIFCNFSKNLIYRTPPDDCSCWFSVPTKVLSTDRTMLAFSSTFFLLLLIIAIMGFYSKSVWKIRFFTFYNSFLLFTYMLLRKFCLGNNLPTHIKESLLLELNVNRLDLCTKSIEIFVEFGPLKIE